MISLAYLNFYGATDILYIVFGCNYITSYGRSFQSFSQEYDLACHTTYVVSGNFIYEFRNLQFNDRMSVVISLKFLEVSLALSEEFSDKNGSSFHLLDRC